jgi:hypothetical protein
MSSPSGLAKVDHDLVFAEWWTDEDSIQYHRKKSAKCAEVLVPQNVSSVHLLGAYVSGGKSFVAMQSVARQMRVAVDRHLFFMS